MRILLLNTSDQVGGAAIAATRLLKALNKNKIDAHMVVRDKTSKSHSITAITPSSKYYYNFIVERLRIFLSNLFSRKNLFAISIANTGSNVTELPEFKQADIIHLHWINQGFLSLKELDKIVKSGKPIVWTMHDMWPITGICHPSRECNKYKQNCGECPFLNRNKQNDLSQRIFTQKKEIYKKSNIQFIGCSNWLSKCADESRLTTDAEVHHIPNPINTEVFKPRNQETARKNLNLPVNKKLILFGAAKSTDKRKGIDYFVKACKKLKHESNLPIAVVVFGKESNYLTNILPYPVYSLGYLKDEQDMIDAYSAVDLFAIPSLEENLPNTIMESMACGTPCVGFDIGGIPELIDHLHNGYVAKYKSTTDLAEGIQWILNNRDSFLNREARRKVIDNYSEDIVAKKYIKIYNQLVK